MQRRNFLKLVGRTSAGVAFATPVLGPAAVDAQGQRFPLHAHAGGSGDPTLAHRIDKGWSVARDADNSGRARRWFTAAQPGAKPIRVPSIAQEVFPGEHGVFWYWVKFAAEANPFADGATLLRFQAIDYLADVWVNGVYLGSHEGGETPFEVDATQAITSGAANYDREGNLLAIRVLNPIDQPIDGIVLSETPHRNKFVHYGNGALPDFGGIIAPVDLLFCPAVRIENVFVRSDWKTGRVQLTTTLQSILKDATEVNLRCDITRQDGFQIILHHEQIARAGAGSSSVESEFFIAAHQIWSMEEPNLYRVDLHIDGKGFAGRHDFATRFGFRDFRVVRGFFRLNDRRIFLKCTHTGNHVPFGQVVPPPGALDLLRKDLVYAKASGFNTVRFISGAAYPYQLDLCDELGLLVYEESSASWLLRDASNQQVFGDSPGAWRLADSKVMRTRYERAVREVILRDRNHPCIAIWGLLNETEDTTVYREAASALSLVRSLDQTRLVLLSSGRFDGDLGVGSLSNPGTTEWQYEWGKEAPGAPKVAMKYPSGLGVGDFHLYPKVPQTPEVNHMIRTLGEGGNPVFLSEYGIGSMMNVIEEQRWYEQNGIPETAEDFVRIRFMAEHFLADWKSLGMEVVYPFAETLLQRSQLSMARHRLLGFNLVRSNPNICGFNLTGMLDHALTGEGLWRFWRDWKPGAFDAVRDGWAPVRWCLFVEPTHTYTGRPVRIEAVLANEDAVAAGNYPAEVKVWGPAGQAWSREVQVSIPGAAADQDTPLAVTVLSETITLDGPAGAYDLVPSVLKGIATPETSWQFHISDAKDLPKVTGEMVAWGLPDKVESWLGARGLRLQPLEEASLESRQVVLVGIAALQPNPAEQWKKLATLAATGSTVVFLSPQAFSRGKDPAAMLPLAQKGTVQQFNDWLYHKECVAKTHPIFDGLQAGGLLDWYYYGPMLPGVLFQGQTAASEVIAAAFAAGYSTPGGYASGILLATYAFGAGHFLLNSFPILEHVDEHPVADRLLLNLVRYARQDATGASARRAPDFESTLHAIGYAN